MNKQKQRHFPFNTTHSCKSTERIRQVTRRHFSLCWFITQRPAYMSRRVFNDYYVCTLARTHSRRKDKTSKGSGEPWIKRQEIRIIFGLFLLTFQIGEVIQKQYERVQCDIYVMIFHGVRVVTCTASKKLTEFMFICWRMKCVGHLHPLNRLCLSCRNT